MTPPLKLLLLFARDSINSTSNSPNPFPFAAALHAVHTIIGKHATLHRGSTAIYTAVQYQWHFIPYYYILVPSKILHVHIYRTVLLLWRTMEECTYIELARAARTYTLQFLGRKPFNSVTYGLEDTFIFNAITIIMLLCRVCVYLMCKWYTNVFTVV